MWNKRALKKWYEEIYMKDDYDWAEAYEMDGHDPGAWYELSNEVKEAYKEALGAPGEEGNPVDYSWYYRDVRDLDKIDVYHVCKLFAVDDNSGALQHAIKKLLCPGTRGAKPRRQDIEEAIATLQRYLQLG